MSPAQFAIKRPVTIIMIFVSMIAIGLVSSRLLPLEYFPAVDVPFIGIEIPYQGSTAEEVEREITRPVEEVIAAAEAEPTPAEEPKNVELPAELPLPEKRPEQLPGHPGHTEGPVLADG